MKSGTWQPAIRGYIDDLTITTTCHVQVRWGLIKLDEAGKWARMTFKPRKSSLVNRKDNIFFKDNLVIQCEIIPSIKDNPLKYLGKYYDESLRDHNKVWSTEKRPKGWLMNIDKSGLPGKFKAWIFFTMA